MKSILLLMPLSFSADYPEAFFDLKFIGKCSVEQMKVAVVDTDICFEVGKILGGITYLPK